MQVTPINENNTNFKALHVSKESLKAMGTTRRELLKNSVIKEAADKFEVLVKPSKSTYRKDVSWTASKQASAICFGSLGLVSGLILPLVGWLSLPIGLVIAGTSAYGIYAGITNEDKFATLNRVLVQAGESFSKGKLTGMKSCQYEMESPKEKLPNIARELTISIYGPNSAKSQNIDADNLYTAENYLAMLDNIDTETNAASFLHKKCNDKGDTFLTQFFDIYPDENPEVYDKIIKKLSNIKGLDFNQKGALGISCLEKIMNSENEKAIPLVNNFEFNYTPELEYAYQNIRNKNFKRKVQKLNIQYSDILEAVRLQSYDALNQLDTQLDSPLCDRKKLAKEINKILKSMDDKSYEGYFRSIYPKYLNKADANLFD